MPGLGGADGTFVTLVFKMVCGKMPVSPSDTNRLLDRRRLTVQHSHDKDNLEYDNLKVS